MSLRGVLLWSVAGHVCLIAAAMRHAFFWGAGRELFGLDLPYVLNALEGLALVLFTVLAGIAYVRGCKQGLEVPAILKCGLVVLVAAVLAPPFLSTDVFDYVARGRVESVHGANPYLVSPSAFPDDPLTHRAQWAEHGMVYGPIAAVLQSVITAALGDRLWVCVYGFKLFFAACHLLTAWLVYLTLRARGSPRASLGLFLYLWNPWILLESVGSGHNDALMALFLAAMGWMLARGQMAWATLAFGLAVLTKHGCAVIGPLLLILAIRQQKLRQFGLGALATVAVTAVLAWHYFPTLAALESMTAQIAHRGTSPQQFVVLLLGEGMAPYLPGIGAVVVVAFLLLKAGGVQDLSSFGRCSSHAVLLLIIAVLPLFSPWYHLWWLPLLALWLPGCAASFRHLAFLGPLSYLVYASTRSYGLGHQVWQCSFALAVPVLLLVASRANGPQPGDD
ncbi:MAG: hypothetical protein ACYTKC_12140 [Planctomycetota bacterium]